MKFFKIRKNILLLFVICITLMLSGCENANAESYSQTQTNITQSSSSKNKPNKEQDEKEETIEINTIEPPEDGWTLDQLNEVLYLNGQQIRFPLMFSTLEGEYEIKEKEYYEDSERASGVLYYNDKFVAIISFYEVDNDFKITTLSFPPTYYESEQNYSNYFIINGFGLKDNISNIQKCLGSKFEKDSGFYKFIVGNDEYTILFTDVEENYMIMLFEGVSKND